MVLITNLTKLIYPDEKIYEIDLLSAKDTQLMDISNQFGLALSHEEMRKIRQYFQNKNRNPTDIELQSLGQAWSEHCCYKSSKLPLQKYVFGIEENRIIAREDAGVIEFDNDHYYCAALESHNHPSAIEPYGGAATGVGGIVRDIVCMGAQPIAYIDPLFFGPLDFDYNLLPKGVKHPIYLFKGVVDGIRDYGNRIGIPTLAGQVVFHQGYIGNCLVNVGCIGVMKKRELIHSRAKKPGNIYIYVGGKTGRDGIHGVTFASSELTDDSEDSSRSAVQVGDPITKEPLIHATLECNQKGLLEGLKDFGGGGLSCVCGELAYAAGLGAEIHLDEIPLKEKGLHPWEIWVSESQERMMFLADSKNVDEILHICKQWDVSAVPIGTVIKEKITRVYYHGKKILEMDMDFLTGGPIYDACQRPYIIPKSSSKDNYYSKIVFPNLRKTILQLLKMPNIASKEWVIRQYDYEVRGNTVIKPLQGKLGCESHGDATVIKPLENSFRGLAVTADVNPYFIELDPYWGASSAVDEICRNLVSVGARPDALLDCLNFGNPEKPDRMGEFYESCHGLGDMARALHLPFVSGNVSFYNESMYRAVPPTPELVGIGIVEDIRQCVTSDLKKVNNPIYLFGRETDLEFGGSAFYQLLRINGGNVPRCDAKLLDKYCNTLLTAINQGFIASCHDISEGGLCVCLSEMCIGGDIGVMVDLSQIKIPHDKWTKLFAETNSRWIVEIKSGYQEKFEKLCHQLKIPIINIGLTIDEPVLDICNPETIEKLSVSKLRKNWTQALWKKMG